MFLKIKDFFFYNENRTFLQKNVIISSYLALLYGIKPLYTVLYNQNPHVPVLDFVLILFVLSISLGVKKYDKYYPRIIFIILVPLFNWMIVDSIIRSGAIGALWTFPVISAFFFCLYKNTAFLAILITLVVSIIASFHLIPDFKDFVRVFITLSVSTLCISMVVINFYQQYNLLQENVRKDSLTDLLNRSMLKEVLINSTLKPQTELRSVLLFFDLDDFKYINDTFGHDVGDATLINIAVLFKKQVRTTDRIFRIGGEEFLILLNDINVSNAEILANKICKEIAHADLCENGHTVTSSIGLAAYEPHEKWQAWLKRSDNAMYSAKNTGKNKVVIAD